MSSKVESTEEKKFLEVLFAYKEDQVSRIVKEIQEPTTAAQFFILAMDKYFKTEKKEAIQHFESCLKLDKNHKLAIQYSKELNDIYFLSDKGDEQTKKHNYTSAIEFFNQSLRMKTKNRMLNAHLLVRLSLAQLHSSGENKEALKTIDLALSMDPTNQAASMTKVMIMPETYCRDGNELKYFKQILFSGDKVKTMIEIGRSFVEEGKLKEALNAFTTGIKRKSSHMPSLFYERSGVHMQLENFDEAFQDINAALDSDSSNIEFKLRKAKISVAIADFGSAMTTLVPLMKSRNASVDELCKVIMECQNAVLLGKIARINKRFKEALKHYYVFADKLVRECNLWVEFLELLLINDKYDEAKQYMDDMKATIPKSDRYRMSLFIWRIFTSVELGSDPIYTDYTEDIFEFRKFVVGIELFNPQEGIQVLEQRVKKAKNTAKEFEIYKATIIGMYASFSKAYEKIGMFSSALQYVEKANEYYQNSSDMFKKYFSSDLLSIIHNSLFKFHMINGSQDEAIFYGKKIIENSSSPIEKELMRKELNSLKDSG